MYIFLLIIRLLFPVFAIALLVLHFSGATNTPMLIVIFGILTLSFFDVLLAVVRPSLSDQQSDIKLVNVVMQWGLADPEWSNGRKVMILVIIFLSMLGAIYMGISD